MDNNPKDPKQTKATKDKKRRQKSAFMHYQLGLVLHLNFSVHIFLLTVVNILVGGIVVGLTSRFFPIISVETIEAFFIATMLFTLLEVFIKGIMVRYLYKFVLMTFGIMFYLTNLLSFWIIDLSISQITFLYNGTNIFTFTFIFMMIRLLFTTYVRKSKWIQGGL